MKLKFKQQQYQTDATMSLVNCFVGQEKGFKKDLVDRISKIHDEGTLLEKLVVEEVISFGNHNISLTDGELRKNIRAIQKANDINYTDDAGFNDFSIEMETGTGKTYTYINTMYQLHEQYGWSKFIIMVPSIAIREGVQKSLEITAEHFQELYHKKIRFFVYNSQKSSNIANINSFASESSIQVMIINYQAFNSKTGANRRIYEELDELQSRRPIDVIKSVKPILIVDEPQKIGDKTEGMLSEFNPLFTVRYSATHKKDKEYNKVYRLDAIDAYNQKLVKKISVKGLELLNNKSEDAYLYLERIDISENNKPKARLEIEVKSASGTGRVSRSIKVGDNLFQLSGELAQYKDYVVSEIDCRGQYDKLIFTNGREVNVGQVIGDVETDFFTRIQIRETIRSHIDKEKMLFQHGIKVLSLFFIDEVAKYKEYYNGVAYKGLYAKIFEEEYNAIVQEVDNEYGDNSYKEYLTSFETGKIHNGYFSVDEKGNAVDSKINDRKEQLSFDEDAYELIMRDKERLLSQDEPVRFIFSHSALREGWDNPNVFQICTLKRSNSEISKRQEIGRGLRICVDKNGNRMDHSVLENDFHTINTLTVIASESYDKFAFELQSEISKTLSSRPTHFTAEIFQGRELVNNQGEQFTFDSITTMDFIMFNVSNGYVDKNNSYKVTDKLIEDLERNQLQVMPHLVGFEEQVTDLLRKLYYTNSNQLIYNENKNSIRKLKPNKNFRKKEFQELWNKINVKSVYEVSFNTDELIKKCVSIINANLEVTKMSLRITVGEQTEKISSATLNAKESMQKLQSTVEKIEDSYYSNVLYDLVGTLANDTNLTRKTIVEILTKIESRVFSKFKQNPEEFLRKIVRLINNEKATTIIEGITYFKTEQKYDNSIFTINSVNGQLDNNAIELKKHIYDYLITDSNTEKRFARELESGEVSVYAKLPNGFKIPTPVGNYNPDWAIVFDKPDCKYIYFIAETKGSLDSMELRQVEQAKITCARKHFESISNGEIKYDVVDSYEALLNIIM